MDSHSRSGESGTVGSCMIKSLLLANDVVLLAYSEQGVQHALYRFPVAYDQAGMKINTERSRFYVSPSRIPRQSVGKQAGIHCRRWRRSSTLGWYSRVKKGRTKRPIHRLVKKTQLSVSFIVSWRPNRSFQKAESCQFFNQSLLRSSPMVIHFE